MTIFVIWLSFWFGGAIVSATSKVWGWAHAHPVTKYITTILGSVGLGAISTPQDMALLIILLVITCCLLPIPHIMLNVMHFLAFKLEAFWTDFQPINTTLQHDKGPHEGLTRDEMRESCRLNCFLDKIFVSKSLN